MSSVTVSSRDFC